MGAVKGLMMALDEARDELLERLQAANIGLLRLAEEATECNQMRRIEAKAEGVRLAMSYVREMT